jgi:hypothetical protein
MVVRGVAARYLGLPAAVITTLCLSHATLRAQEPGVESPVETETTSSDGQESEPVRPWYERLRFSGDFRSRYEGFYQSGATTRNRGRLRLRLRIDTDINEDASFHLQVASGDPGTPVSTNQTFTSFFRPKPFNLDRAYLVYNPQAASAMTLGLGKFGFPQARTQMIFDDDLNVEGGWEEVAWSLGDGIDISLGGLQTIVNELSSDADSYMVAGYGEVTVALGSHSLQFSAANYQWGHVDQIAVAQSVGVLGAILTNEVVRNDPGVVTGFASGFNVVDVIAEATFQTGRADYPVRFLVDVAHNTQAENDRDSGFWVEAEYGRPRAANTWGAGYTYGWIQQDVTPSAFVFSDMPGTNLRLHMVEASYVPKPGLSLDLTLHISKRLEPAPSELDTWLSRLHLAAVIRF